ncbi:MAG: S8 family serine peptidase, partial [Planctomycetota bacterium]|nr:S8 family serine peptidase [Planctomycetota bacterium]
YFALAVGATDHKDRAAGFSGGRTQVIRESRFIKPDFLPLVYSKPDLCAPGVAVMSAIPGKKYATWNGTSMTAPHVSGAIALLLSATSIKSEVAAPRRAYLLQEFLMGSVEELGEAGQDHRYGFGRLDIMRAIGFAKEGGY